MDSLSYSWQIYFFCLGVNKLKMILLSVSPMTLRLTSKPLPCSQNINARFSLLKTQPPSCRLKREALVYLQALRWHIFLGGAVQLFCHSDHVWADALLPFQLCQIPLQVSTWGALLLRSLELKIIRSSSSRWTCFPGWRTGIHKGGKLLVDPTVSLSQLRWAQPSQPHLWIQQAASLPALPVSHRSSDHRVLPASLRLF